MQTENLHQAQLLIVDDQEANTLLLEDILETEGYTNYKSIRDSRKVVDAFAGFRPDIVLLDLMMPHLDGYAVMEQLQPLLAQEAYLPILVLTADMTVETKRRALRAGAKDFLTKPLDPIEVLLRIKNLLLTRFLYLELQKRADERIKELASLIDQANDAILVQDTANQIYFWNEGARRLYGWTTDQAQGQNADELLLPAPTPTLDEAREQAVKQGKWSGELEQRTKDGKPILVASRWTVTYDEKGQPKSKLMINTDITEKKHLEASLIQSQRIESIGLLAGGIAHDFNNLMTIVLGCSEVMLASSKPSDPMRPLIGEIQKAGNRAATLTRQLLTFARKQILTPMDLDLNLHVSEVQKMLHRLIREDVSLVVALSPSPVHINADPSQIEQILINLAVNARDAMPAGGMLVIETSSVELDDSFSRRGAEVRPGPYVLLSVTDTGCGMDDQTKKRIFEPFFTTKEFGKGTGLGLATVYGIVKQFNGHIEVFSELGKGTSFHIYLPRVTFPASPVVQLNPAGKLSGGSETILLAEDQEDVRGLARFALQSEGYTVLEAPDGEEAIQVCGQHPSAIHLLVTDVVMPKLNGPQLAKVLARTHPTMKVLYMSGYTNDTLAQHGVSEGKIAFLNKPFTPGALIRKVREVLDGEGFTSREL